MASTYYVFVGSRSENLRYNDVPFLSLMGTPAPAKEKETRPQVEAGGSS
jgi:hypothetical protein